MILSATEPTLCFRQVCLVELRRPPRQPRSRQCTHFLRRDEAPDNGDFVIPAARPVRSPVPLPGQEFRRIESLGKPGHQADVQPDHEVLVLSDRRIFGDQQGPRGQRLGVEPMVRPLLVGVEEEHQRADALVATSEGVVLDNETDQMRRLFLAALGEGFAEHGLPEVAGDHGQRIPLGTCRTAVTPRFAPSTRV